MYSCCAWMLSGDWVSTFPSGRTGAGLVWGAASVTEGGCRDGDVSSWAGVALVSFLHMVIESIPTARRCPAAHARDLVQPCGTPVSDLGLAPFATETG